MLCPNFDKANIEVSCLFVKFVKRNYIGYNYFKIKI